MNYKEKIEKLEKEMLLSADVLKEKLSEYLDTEADIELGDSHIINLSREDVINIKELETEVRNKLSSLEYIIAYLPNKDEPVVVKALKSMCFVQHFIDLLNLDDNIGLGHIKKVV